MDQVLVEVTDRKGNVTQLKLSADCSIRDPRPIARRLPITRPLVTGQRIIDTLFPIGKGGAAAIPGPFGAGRVLRTEGPPQRPAPDEPHHFDCQYLQHAGGRP